MTPRRIVIEEHGSQSAPAPKPSDPRFDLQDALLLGGVLLLETAAFVIWWPAALILGGLFSLGFALLIEKAKRLNGTSDQ